MSDQFDSVNHSRRPRLAIALGDPAGIGMEVVLKALADPVVMTSCDITLVGNGDQLHDCWQFLAAEGYPVPDFQQLSILHVDLDADIQRQIYLGVGNAASGEASFQYLERAIAYTLAGKTDGIVTAPIAKSAWAMAGHHYPGQTELLAERAGVTQVGMLFVARSPHTGWVLRTLLATTHISLRQVPDALSPELMTTKLTLLLASLEQDFGILTPHIVVAGLNPHSGEHGQLGQEEQDWLIPWLETARHRYPHLQLDGPVPPDTLWVKPGQAWHHLTTTSGQVADAYIALYHDQGLIPVKLLAFDRAVNTSIGLPFVRTSPDHGTAFDIAGKGVANASSMQAAILLAGEMVYQRLKKS
ncbi:MAG: 4-hydroxythreonine-4-phosphate dehydrogenase PdxA [Cyanobacteriota bacterium SKYGB_h_bin112]|nr:4-hydroxythreonine-4-phosphate dehydrogenase PdxA [Cyanobacteriota bacterium SKYGB_h_bin112]